MKDRIKQIMESENLTPSIFADKLNIGRAVMSHILNGRNNPSLDVVTRILDTMDYIDAEWLLSGKGNMRKSDNAREGVSQGGSESLSSASTAFPMANDLFTESSGSTSEVDSQRTESKDNLRTNGDNRNNTSVNNPILGSPIIPSAIINPQPSKKVNKIIIYYTDNTFEVFKPDSSAL